MRKIILLSSVFILFLSVFLVSCGKKPEQNNKVIVYINGEPIFVKDFNREIALNFKRDPMFRITPEALQSQVGIMRDKRLLIQEAKRLNLDQTDEFVDTIEIFWEQTLIRDLMMHKDKEFEKNVAVTDDEILDYYGKLSYQMTFSVVKSDTMATLEVLTRQNPSTIVWEEEVGPVGYEDAVSPVFYKAFDIAKGEMKIIQDKGGNIYYLIYAKDKIRLELPPFNDMKSQLGEKIRNIKKRQMFNNWLDDVRNKADVKINSDILRKFQYGRE